MSAHNFFFLNAFRRLILVSTHKFLSMKNLKKQKTKDFNKSKCAEKHNLFLSSRFTRIVTDITLPIAAAKFAAWR